MPIKERNIKGKLIFELDALTFAEFRSEAKDRGITLTQLFYDAWEAYKKEIGGLEQRKEEKQ